eukprot:4320762-Karenia_brevis.AAC.1
MKDMHFHSLQGVKMTSPCHHNLQVYFEKCFRLGAGSKIARQKFWRTIWSRPECKIKTGEALLVDPGTPENLVGEQWFQRQSDECKMSGRLQPHYVKMDPPL